MGQQFGNTSLLDCNYAAKVFGQLAISLCQPRHSKFVTFWNGLD